MLIKILKHNQFNKYLLSTYKVPTLIKEMGYLCVTPFNHLHIYSYRQSAIYENEYVQNS